MARPTRQHYVRQMPKIYGNLQRPKRDWGGLFRMVRNIFWGVVVLFFLYLVFLSPWFSVRQVDVQGAIFAPTADIQALVPKGKNIWTVSQQSIITQVMRYPSVQSVSVQRGLPDHVRIVVQERQPALLWVSGNDVLALDDTGVAFARFDRASLPDPASVIGKELAGVPRVYDVKAVPVHVGQQVTGSSFIQFVSTTESQLTSLLPQVTIDHIEISETVYGVTVYTVQGLTVQMSSLSDASVQVRNLTRLIHQGDATIHSTVDLQVDRWAYVK